MSNKVQSLRISLGWSQKRLADRAGTNQRQIQRIEAGSLIPKLDLATKISETLGKSLNEVFPGSEEAITKVVKEIKASGRLPGKNELDQVRLTGVEFDSKDHIFKALLRGHDEPLIFEISSAEHDRLFSLVQDEGNNDASLSCIVFDSDGYRIALNLSELVCCQFLFDIQSPESITDADPSRDPMDDGVTVYLRGSKKPLAFNVDRDIGDPEDEDDAGYFRTILFMIELSPSPSDRYYFSDSDGESVFLRAGDISLMKVPLWVIDPAENCLEEDVLELPEGESIH